MLYEVAREYNKICQSYVAQITKQQEAVTNAAVGCWRRSGALHETTVLKSSAVYTCIFQRHDWPLCVMAIEYATCWLPLGEYRREVE